MIESLEYLTLPEDKIPEDERPSLQTLADTLDSMVSKGLQDLFIVDLQNDCFCTTEPYQADAEDPISYIAFCGEVDTNIYPERISLPLLGNISDKDIQSLCSEATKNASAFTSDVTYSNAVLAGHNVEIPDWAKSYQILRCDVDCDNFIYRIPDKEYFGVISVNLLGVGAMVFGSKIHKMRISG